MTENKKVRISLKGKPGVKVTSKKSQLHTDMYEALSANLALVDKLVAEARTLGDSNKFSEARDLLAISQELIDTNKQIEKVVRLLFAEIK